MTGKLCSEQMSSGENLLSAVINWAESQKFIQALVLYGSQARESGISGGSDEWSDIDLHAIVRSPKDVENVNWQIAFPQQHFCLKILRPAVGGAQKMTILFSEGELEIVILPDSKLRWARRAMWLGFHRKSRSLKNKLNVLATGLRGGYKFLKGEKKWGSFYRRVLKEMPGFRISNDDAHRLADGFICDLSCLLKRLERGEYASVQHALHQRLAETNFVLLRELRLRRNLPVPSFEVARRIESLLNEEEIGQVRVSARPQRIELSRAAWNAFSAMKILMAGIDSSWGISSEVSALLRRHGHVSTTQ